MKINPLVFGLLVVLVFFGTIFGFQQAGVWSTSGKGNSGGGGVEPAQGNAETVKGWMTLEQVSSIYGVPVSEILSAFNLPADTSENTAIKHLESDTFSVGGLRTWLEEHQVP